MFFIFSKILDFLVSPLNWCFLLVVLTFFLKNERLKKRFKLSAFLVLLFFTIPVFFQFGVHLFSFVDIPKANKYKAYEAGIVMGGMLAFNDSNDHLVFNSNCNRLTSALELYKKGVIKRIIISGGSGSVAYPSKREASLLKKFMVNYLSIPDSVIFIENKSDNTRQNAIFTKKLLKILSISKKDLILITSPLHKPRAFLCFKKVGISVVNYEFKVEQKQKKWMPTQTIIPNEETLMNWVSFLHELVGLLVYKLVGYI
jgi:uncharacterized SAM-binding protein YcdF (DUF218 family)